jgi:hypothetical protein
MASPQVKLVGGGAAIFLSAFFLASTAGSRAQALEGNYGVGIPDVFLKKYLTYRAQQLRAGTANVLKVRLGYVKGLS